MSAETSAARMQRLLAMVPWIAAQDGPTVEEVCQRFGITREQLASDLEVVWLVGLPPYTPDALIDVVQEGERVWIHYADVFARPQRLTPDQAVALLSAGASVLALGGAEPDGALARGVRKLAEVLGVNADQVLDVDFGGSDPQVLDVLRQAVREHRRVHLDYWSYGRDTRTERDVDPYLIHAEGGALYLLAHCHRAGGERRFRVDRINRAELLANTFDPPAEHGPTVVFQADDDDPRVTLRLAPEARWVLEAYPVEDHRDLPDGRVEVTLAIGEEQWLARLLVNLGPAAEIVDAPDALVSAGRRAAQRVLARYR
ncbi:MAG TPA: WYL domain-containing protein [Acidimicrobiales bacterium]|nr:WYL domain-containing protein [Acidimicrobiales bacterium]